MTDDARVRIEQAWEDRSLLQEEKTAGAIRGVIGKLDTGALRVAEPSDEGWITHEWIKKAVILYFPLSHMETTYAGPMEFHDKIPLKSHFARLGVRAVPHAVARYGSYLAPGVILMPSYVNIGARVESGTMIDTWVTVGSCAQVGREVHLSGGVGVGGVLEPVQASPVIIEDHCFIGSRCVIVEGVRIGEGAVLGAGVVLTASTRILDVSGPQTLESKGYVPPWSVVIPGTLPKTFPAGEFQVPCALVIGKRKASTDLKTSLNNALREFDVPV